MIDTPPLQKPFVVLPTYNERENLELFIPALFALPIDNLHLLVVDDSSPDGSGEYVILLQSKYKNLHLLSRPTKEGLGRAYVAGFLKSLEMEADGVVQMDADFSHAIQDVPRLLAGLKNSDLVIGSRYIRGGKTENWPISRLVLSKSANIYARLITNIPVFDLTGGFKAWKGIVLRHIHLETVQTNGYGFQIETTARAFKKGYKIKELPITFTERRAGQSKMSKKIIWEALWLVWKLRLG